MKSYIYSVLAASILCAAAVILAPERGGINKYVSFAVSLIMALIILSPLKGVISFDTESIFRITDQEAKTEDEAFGKAKFLSDSVAEAYCIATGEKKENIAVHAETDGNKVTEAEIITNAVPTNKSLSEKLSEIFGIKVTITHRTEKS